MRKLKLLCLCGLTAAVLMTGCAGSTDTTNVNLGSATVSEYRGVKINVAAPEVTDDEVDQKIQTNLKQNPNEVEVDRAAQDGDIVNIDYKGTKDGEAFDGGTAEGTDLTLGSKTMIDGFEDGIIGMKDGEERQMTQEEDFKGYIYDVGGPTANFRFPSCKKQLTHGVCQNKQCLFPKPCKNLTVDHKDYIKLMREIRELPGIKKVFIRSGIRFDYCMADDDDTFMNELCKHYISGQLRVAPEHISDNVLKYMGKPENKVYEAFLKRYARINKKTGKEQFVVPYLMSSHPGSTMKEAIELAEYIRDLGYMPEQVQDFYPTPSTLSTCMYYTGLDPRTMEKVYTPVSPHEKAMQRALIQYRNPENYELVKEALLKNHREDLIGFDRHCLIPPRPMKNGYHTGGTNQGNSKQGSPKQGSQKKGKHTTTQNTRTARQRPAGQKSADNRKSGRSGTRKAGGRKR